MVGILVPYNILWYLKYRLPKSSICNTLQITIPLEYLLQHNLLLMYNFQYQTPEPQPHLGKQQIKKYNYMICHYCPKHNNMNRVMLDAWIVRSSRIYSTSIGYVDSRAHLSFNIYIPVPSPHEVPCIHGLCIIQIVST